MSIGGARRILDLFWRGIRVAEPQIVDDCAVEEVGVLAHDSKMSSDLIKRQLSKINAPHRHATAGWVVKA